MRVLALLARPVLRQRYRVVGGELPSLVRPVDAPLGHASGLDPDRVLVFGNGTAVGYGVRSHDLAVPGQLARELATLTDRGADVHLLARPDITLANAIEVIGGEYLLPYDVVVAVIGASDAYQLISIESWRRQMDALITHIVRATSESTPIVVVGVAPISSIPFFGTKGGGIVDRWTQRLNVETRRLVIGRDRVHYLAPPDISSVEVGPEDRHRYRSPQHYRVWAAAVARRLAPLLDEQAAGDGSRGGAARVIRKTRQSEERRIQAIKALELPAGIDTPRIDRIVQRTRDLFRSDVAAFTLVGANESDVVSIIGMEWDGSTVPSLFGMHAVGASEPLVVTDTTKDARFDSGTLARFYAGYPVEAPGGARVGVLSVLDTEPRTMSDVELQLLRDLALEIQDELARWMHERFDDA
ncbi:hypothetical protein ACPEEZ_01645 [Frigoribacterium sp. 2-23]|uniref:hypothetical protein n=1 Tax=Frigoribacterium sp. 2-23 TaxID=3415006 RepID=UPI003C704CC6